MNICVYMSVCVFVRNAPKSDVMSNFSAAQKKVNRQKIKREQFYEIEKNRVVGSHKMVFLISDSLSRAPIFLAFTTLYSPLISFPFQLGHML